MARCLQGGGVRVRSGTVSIVNSQVYSNQANYVRAHVQNIPSPHSKMADMLALTQALAQLQGVRAAVTFKFSHRPDVGTLLTCLDSCTTVADAPINCSGYVPQRPETFPFVFDSRLLDVCREEVSMSLPASSR